MALGLGFNKAKILQTAEKYVLQGKLPAAIGEYQKILRRDPKDLMTLNSVGDLYVRSGKMDEATKCFYALAEKSIEAGFVPRAIAVYKRITKIDQEALPALTKLGELYSLQGLMRDSRTHYLQAVEILIRRQERGKAREIFEKVLMLDTNNPRLQRRMAELYVDTGKNAEAIATYLIAAEQFLHTRGFGESSATLETLLKLDPENTAAQVLRGRLLLEQGDAAGAIEILQAIAAKGAGKGVLEYLFQAYLEHADLENATQIARQVFDEHQDFALLTRAADEMVGKGDAEGALRIYQGAAEKLRAQGAFTVLSDGLKKILSIDSSNIVALELLWGVYRRTGSIAEGRETAELLAHAYMAAEQLAQARDVYAELVALEPDVVEHQRLLKQVETRLGADGGMDQESGAGAPTPLMAMEAAVDTEAESIRVGILPPRDQALVLNCLTESEIFLTYHQVPRAIEILEKGLAEVPGDASLHEHLILLYEQTGQYAKAANCAVVLTEIYLKLGDNERAARYEELRIGYQQKAEAGGPTPVMESTVETNFAEPLAALPESPQEQPQVREIDLSMEWASVSEQGAPASPEPTAESTSEEIEFYLEAGLVTEAATAIGRLRESSPGHPSLAGFEKRLAALLPGTTQFVEESQGGLVAESAVQDIADTPEIAVSEGSVVETLMSDPEMMGSEIEQRTATTDVSAMEPPSAPESATPSATSLTEQGLMLADILQSKGAAASPSGFELSLEEPQKSTPPAAAAWAGAEPGGFLDDVFAQFKEDVGEATGTGDDDIETHYNMGVAFKEMALYDEAIGEFQRVHQLGEKAKDYSHIVQCCSLLATCFLEKGLPQLAVKWYQTAIDAPGVDAESSLALLYELASAQETAGDRAAALKSFMEVYARNIDYRNVSDRIRDLQQRP